jgi:hypothetical protein
MKAICAVVIGLLALSNQVSASVSAAVSFEVKLQLVDIDLDDGITPSVTFTDPVWSHGAFASDGVHEPQDTNQARAIDTWVSSRSVSIAAGSASSSVAGSLLEGTFSFSNAAMALSNSRSGAGGSFYGNFVLSPMTELRASVQAHFDVATLGYGFKDLVTSTTLELSGTIGGEWWFQNPSLSTFYTTPPGDESVFWHYKEDRSMSGSFVNDTSEITLGTFQTFGHAFAADGFVAVPVSPAAMPCWCLVSPLWAYRFGSEA